MAVSIATGRTAAERQAAARERGKVQPLGKSQISTNVELGGNSQAHPRLLTFDDGTKAIWKKDQPNNRAEAEVMVYKLSKLLGLDVVPETVYLEISRDRFGSCQRFIDGARTAMEFENA